MDIIVNDAECYKYIRWELGEPPRELMGRPNRKGKELSDKNHIIDDVEGFSNFSDYAEYLADQYDDEDNLEI